MTLREPPLERLVLDVASEFAAGRLLCNSSGRGQFAADYAQQHPHCPVTCWFLDLYQLQQSRPAPRRSLDNLNLICQPDPPVDERDLVVWSLSRQGASELAREMLQVGQERLVIGGQLVVAVDNPRDKWVHSRLTEMFTKVVRQPHQAGVIYRATKTSTLKKRKNYAAEFPFRDGERLIHLRTRPGVFSHRELDGGARALLRSMAVTPGMRVLELGCGSGAVTVAAALRAADVHVHAIDSNPRAVESTLWAANRNHPSHVTATLDCDGTSIPPAAYDLVVTNPPYYSDFRIARRFLDVAARSLRIGGDLFLVTKTPQWYADHLPPAFSELTARPVGNYTVLSARRA